LQDLTRFTPFGKVVSVKIEKINGRSSGIGHVEFKSLPDAQKAVSVTSTSG
jgi:RNA recognition motif-containing protein